MPPVVKLCAFELLQNNISIELMKEIPLYLQFLHLIPNEYQPYDILRNMIH